MSFRVLLLELKQVFLVGVRRAGTIPECVATSKLTPDLT